MDSFSKILSIEKDYQSVCLNILKVCLWWIYLETNANMFTFIYLVTSPKN